MARIPENIPADPLSSLGKALMVMFGMALVIVGLVFLVFAGIMVAALLDFHTKPEKPAVLLCMTLVSSLACCFLAWRAAWRLIGNPEDGMQVIYVLGDLCLGGAIFAAGLIYPSFIGGHRGDAAFFDVVGIAAGLSVFAYVFYKSAGYEEGNPEP